MFKTQAGSSSSFGARGAALLCGVAAVLAASHAGAQVRVPTHVACVGDSITFGYGLSSPMTQSYPAVLQNMFGSSVQVRNFGVSGTTMMSIADNPYVRQGAYNDATTFVSGAGAGAVVDVIIMLGTNDSKFYNWMPMPPATRAQQFVTDCTALVDHFASLSTHPLVYLALPSRSFANAFDISGAIIHDQMLPLIRQVAAAKGIPVIDVDTPTATHPELFPDGVHPTDVGYALIAQVMHDGLLRPLPAGTDAGATDAGGAGGRGTGGAVAGTGGRGVGGASGAGGMGAGGSVADAGRSDTAATGTGGTPGGTGGRGSGGTTGGSGGTTGAGGDAGTSGSSGCSCRLSAGGSEGRGAGLLLLVTVVFAAFARRPGSRRR